MRALMLLATLSPLLFAVGTAGASPDPYRDQAERIACPSPPSGWVNPADGAGGRTILTPLTAVEQVDDPTLLSGAPIVQVDCHYYAGGGVRSLQVSVRYALPIDLNPWNDFYVGCTATGRPQPPATRAFPWNEHDRVYRVVGAKTWSLATFIDDLRAVRRSEVPRFKAMTNAMLKAAQPFAHNCSLAGNGKPVDLKSVWSFSFDARTTKGGVTSRGRTSGSFVTTASDTGGTVGTISSLLATSFRLTVTSKGKARWVGIRVGTPIEFHHSYGSLLRAHVVVTASTVAGCRAGAKGSLLISVQSLTAPRVSLRVCGKTYLDGKGTVRAQIQTV